MTIETFLGFKGMVNLLLRSVVMLVACWEIKFIDSRKKPINCRSRYMKTISFGGHDRRKGNEQGIEEIKLTFSLVWSEELLF